MSLTSLSHPYLALTHARALPASSRRISSWSSNWLAQFAIAASSSRGTRSPRLGLGSNSSADSKDVHTTGRPAHIASNTALGRPSKLDVKQNTSAAANQQLI